MAIRFGTPEWADALERELNASSEYRNAAAKWGKGFNGNVLLALEADGAMPRSFHLLVRLAEGACRGCAFVEGPGHSEAAFVLRGAFSLWRQILENKTLAATAILTGKLKVEGDKMTLLKHTAAHRALVASCTTIDTEFVAF